MIDEPAPEPAPAAAPAKIAIWDVPTRLFHWTLVGLIGLSWWSAEEHYEDVHVYSGIAVLTLLVFRLLWGLFGSSTARFASFVRGPKTVFGYLAGRWSGIGHSPLGALSVVALLLVTLGQVGLGLFASDEDGLIEGPLAGMISLDAGEEIAELHEQFFDVLLILVVVHIGAILFYRLKGKSLVAPMISGRGRAEPGVEPMRPGKWWVALLCLVAAIAFSRWILAGAPPFGA